jgi:hypothetical protein
MPHKGDEMPQMGDEQYKKGGKIPFCYYKNPVFGGIIQIKGCNLYVLRVFGNSISPI